jgi:hypothetical protein
MSADEIAYSLKRHVTAAAFMLVGFGIIGGIALTAEVPRPEANIGQHHCRDSDATSVAGLKALLDRTDAKTTAVTVQAFRHILAARSFCDGGYGERGLALYREADLVLAGFRERGAVAYDR